jgi:hypothetical protein
MHHHEIRKTGIKTMRTASVYAPPSVDSNEP